MNGDQIKEDSLFTFDGLPDGHFPGTRLNLCADTHDPPYGSVAGGSRGDCNSYVMMRLARWSVRVALHKNAVVTGAVTIFPSSAFLRLLFPFITTSLASERQRGSSSCLWRRSSSRSIASARRMAISTYCGRVSVLSPITLLPLAGLYLVSLKDHSHL